MKHVGEAVDEIKKSLEEHSHEIYIMENLKKRDFDDETLFILWAYLMEKLEVSPVLSVFDLTKEEYAFCMGEIYNTKDLCKYSYKLMREEESWNKGKTDRRMANDIIMTYKRRGHHFMRDFFKPRTELQNKWLDCNWYGFLNDSGREIAKKILNVATTNPT